MSISTFKAFKETLKSCKNISSSTSSSSASLFAESLSQEPEPGIVFRRKPPKSTLSKQLQRLGDSFSSLQQSQSQSFETQQPGRLPSLRNQSQVEKNEDEVEEEEKEERKFENFAKPELCQVQFDHTGPFEPLILSLPGEVPIVQVTYIILFF